MADGTKSSDHAAPAKKKAKSETKPGKKRDSSIAAKAKSSAAKEQPKKVPGRPKKGKDAAAEDSANDLDIEGEESKLEASD